jgi:hypothetical protein
MKIFKVISRAGESGETILGAEDTGSHACYLIYGRMRGREKNRRLKPGKGHEEILLALQGDFGFSGQAEGTLKQGQAIHLRGEETLFLKNLTDRPALYVLAGGHSEAGNH